MATILEILDTTISSDPNVTLQLFKDNFIDDIDDYRNEYDGDREIRQSQIGFRLPKKSETPTKIPIPLQKRIVKTATNFLVGKPLLISTNNPKVDAVIRKVWKKNRMDSSITSFVRNLKKESQAVMFFHIKDGATLDDGKTGKIQKISLYDSKNGQYAPLFDEYGDLVAFLWSFTTLDATGKKIEKHWIFTDKATVKYTKSESGFDIVSEPNLLAKIPVVFMRQDDPEWFDVKELIDRYEMNFSKFTDTNDYFGSPTLVLTGKVNSVPAKEKMGKAIRVPKVEGAGVDKTGKVEYLTWQHAPASTELEFKINKELIYSLTETPDISFDNLKGNAPASGLAMEMQFLGATLKAVETQNDFKITVERILNILLKIETIIGSEISDSDLVDLDYDIEFQSPLPKNIDEFIAMLTEATGGEPVLSQKSGVRLNPLIDSDELEEEMTNLDNEATKKNQGGETFQI